MANISQSASVDSIAEYLRHTQGLDHASADAEAAVILENFQKMRAQGYIKGWCFDKAGHLDLIPTDSMLEIFDRVQK